MNGECGSSRLSVGGKVAPITFMKLKRIAVNRL
jgi:hypothetical protein